MRLILNVTSSKNHLSDRANRFVFDQRGGSIGRAQDNDCVLPDPERFISNHHADIQYKDGAYILTDTSANGVFLNDSDQPVGENNTIRLSDGDCLSIGDYELRVAIEPANQAGGVGRPGSGFESPGVNPAVSPWGVPGTQGDTPGILDGSDQHAIMPGFSGWDKDEAFMPPSRRPATEPDHTPVEQENFVPPSMQREQKSPAWDRTDFVSPSDHESRKTPDRNHADFTSASSQEGKSTPDWDRTEFTSPSDHESSSSREWDRTDFTPPLDQEERSLPERDRDSIPREDVSSSATSQPEPVPETGEPGESSRAFKHVPPTTNGDADKSIPDSTLEPRKEPGNGVDPVHAFFQAAGLNATQIPSEAAPVLMELFGGLFREIVQGLMDVLRARSDLKNEFRMRHTQIRTTENNPLKFSGRVDEALEHLVFNRNSGFLSPEAAFREAFQDIKDHQIAMVVGMRAAFESLLRRFDPELLESRIIKGKKIGNLLPVSRKARCWEFYEEWYAEIFAAAEDDFQRFFGDEFTRAYEDQMARLSLLRKKPGR